MSRLLPSLPDVSLEDREPRVVDVDDDDADDLIDALSSETARAALTALHEQPSTTSELADELDTTLQNVQYHLGNLREADLVEVVDTVYSEKGREMNVYAPADEPLVLFAGSSTTESGVKTALKRLLTGYGILGLSALAAQRLLSVSVPETGDASADGDSGGASGTATESDGMVVQEDSTTESLESATTSGTETPNATYSGDAVDAADAAADYALSLLEPGVVFFLGAALVFTVVWAYWYRSAWRQMA
ncbi:ArsR/SmtB family transcription factor [Haloparvum sp. PAK95]|uniref:ArsR/SmtB family transcription factor n=1 Tax=Haloparvum sp. PAK95 TaxID=3418962 RepID=UPI003D2F1CF2